MLEEPPSTEAQSLLLEQWEELQTLRTELEELLLARQGPVGKPL